MRWNVKCAMSFTKENLTLLSSKIINLYPKQHRVKGAANFLKTKYCCCFSLLHRGKVRSLKRKQIYFIHCRFQIESENICAHLTSLSTTLVQYSENLTWFGRELQGCTMPVQLAMTDLATKVWQLNVVLLPNSEQLAICIQVPGVRAAGLPCPEVYTHRHWCPAPLWYCHE